MSKHKSIVTLEKALNDFVKSKETHPVLGTSQDHFRWGVEHIQETITELHRPIPLILNCPGCRERHIDKETFPLHHTHACQHCGFVWRPSLLDTIGVQFLPGFKD